MYILIKGSVDIKVEGRVVDQLGAGDVFGEMAMIDAQTRSADAVARSDSDVVRIDEAQFLAMTMEKPEFALQVMRLIVERLRHRMADLEEVRSYLGMLQG